VKNRRARTNARAAEGQLAQIDTRETRLRWMARELNSVGVNVPEFKGKGKDTSLPAGPVAHHWIARESDSRIALNLGQFQYAHPEDPAVQVWQGSHTMTTANLDV
jgi:hypothetical protein